MPSPHGIYSITRKAEFLPLAAHVLVWKLSVVFTDRTSFTVLSLFPCILFAISRFLHRCDNYHLHLRISARFQPSQSLLQPKEIKTQSSSSPEIDLTEQGEGATCGIKSTDTKGTKQRVPERKKKTLRCPYMAHKPRDFPDKIEYKQLRLKRVWVACQDKTRTCGWGGVCAGKPERGTDGEGHAAPSWSGTGDLSPRKSSLCESSC